MAARSSAVLDHIDVAVGIALDLENYQLRRAMFNYRRAGAYQVPAIDGTANFVHRIAFLTLFPVLGVAAAVERRGADDALRLWGRHGIGEAQEAQSRDGGDGGEELHFVGLASDLIMGLVMIIAVDKGV